MSPVGRWSLSVDPAAIALLDDGALDDFMLVIGYEGLGPAWPA
jgi:hypothetical protein